MGLWQSQTDDSSLMLDQTTPQTITGDTPIFDSLTASELISTDGTKQLQSLAVATYPSLTEIAHVKGVTSAIQTQLDRVPASTAASDFIVGEAATGKYVKKTLAETQALIGAIGSTTYASRSITSATGGVLNIVLGSASGDDFTVGTNKFVVEGDTGNIGFGVSGTTAKLSLGVLTGPTTGAPVAATSATTKISFNDSGTNAYGMGIGDIRNSAYDIWWQTGATNGGGYRWYIGTSEKMTMDYLGNVGIATTAPAGKLDVSFGGLTLVLGAENSSVNRTNGADKYTRIGNYHFINTEEPMTLIFGQSGTAASTVYVGGGTAAMNAATAIRFYTASNTTTTTGTERMSINSSGVVNVVGEITAGTKTFKIDHPVVPNDKILYHMAIEGPRADLIYRGTVKLVNGKATVDLNKGSSFAGMMDGTFEALTQNAKVTSLHASDSFDRVKSGPITGATFEITSENTESTDAVTWVVMAERNDAFIRNMSKTDDDGHLITEWDKEDPDLSRLEDETDFTDKIEENGNVTFGPVFMEGKGYKLHPEAFSEKLETKKVTKVFKLEEVKEEKKEGRILANEDHKRAS